MIHTVYSVRFSVMLNNSSLLTIILHSLVRTTFFFNDIKYYFYDVITDFDSVPVTLSSPRRRTVRLCPLILRLGKSQRRSGQITEETNLLPVPEIETRFPSPLTFPRAFVATPSALLRHPFASLQLAEVYTLPW
jgi:hypothetical protein